MSRNIGAAALPDNVRSAQVPEKPPLGAWQAPRHRLTARFFDRTGPAPAHDPISRRGGREVECAALEMRCTGNRTVGSNPTLSARLPFPDHRIYSQKPQKVCVSAIETLSEVLYMFHTISHRVWVRVWV